MIKSLTLADLSDLQKKAAITISEENSDKIISYDDVIYFLSDLLAAPERKRDEELICGTESLATLFEKIPTLTSINL